MEIIKNAGTDYRWRTFVDRTAFAALVSTRVQCINYTNFKNSVDDHDLHELYLDFWAKHKRYQQEELTERSANEGSRSTKKHTKEEPFRPRTKTASGKKKSSKDFSDWRPLTLKEYADKLKAIKPGEDPDSAFLEVYNGGKKVFPKE